ncbi:MAG: hypothetical protein IJ764_07560 [Bacteroidales bacterium]|nr:hypothetical protein [Bacteroidales bacterium]
MNKNLFLFLVVAISLAFCSCGKEKRCRCMVDGIVGYQTVTSTYVLMDVDETIECGDITMVGDEWLGRDNFEMSQVYVSCQEE